MRYFLFALALAGCGPSAPNPCTPAALAEIEARRAAETIAACVGKYPSQAACPAAAEIRARYDNAKRGLLCK